MGNESMQRMLLILISFRLTQSQLLVQNKFWDCSLDSPSSLPGVEQVLIAGFWWHHSYPSLAERCPWNHAVFNLHSGVCFPLQEG